MDDQEFLEVFRQSANLLQEQTVQQLLEDNAAYEEICRQEEMTEQQYLQLVLTEEQRTVIDAMLLEKERSCLLYADTAYLAGIKNVLQLRRALQL